MIYWLKYYWKYYIVPVFTLISPGSQKGLKLRQEKLEEDEGRKSWHIQVPWYTIPMLMAIALMMRVIQDNSPMRRSVYRNIIIWLNRFKDKYIIGG